MERRQVYAGGRRRAGGNDEAAAAGEDTPRLRSAMGVYMYWGRVEGGP